MPHDNAAAESFFSTLEHEVLSRHTFATRAEARAVIGAWCQDFYNNYRRHTTAGGLPPAEYEKMPTDTPSGCITEASTIRGEAQGVLKSVEWELR